MGNGCVAPVVLNLTTRMSEWSVSRLCSFDQHTLKRSLDGLRSQSGNLTRYESRSSVGNHTTIAGSSSQHYRRY